MQLAAAKKLLKMYAPQLAKQQLIKMINKERGFLNRGQLLYVCTEIKERRREPIDTI